MSKDDNKPNVRIESLEKTCGMYATEIGRLEFKIGTLQAEISRLNSELARQRGVKQQARDFYAAVDTAIIARIDARGRRKVKVSPEHYIIDASKLQTTDKQDLIRTAQMYDAEAYFRLKSPVSGMRLQYRIISKAYRVFRDTGFYILKKTYRVAKKGL